MENDDIDEFFSFIEKCGYRSHEAYPELKQEIIQRSIVANRKYAVPIIGYWTYRKYGFNIGRKQIREKFNLKESLLAGAEKTFKRIEPDFNELVCNRLVREKKIDENYSKDLLKLIKHINDEYDKSLIISVTTSLILMENSKILSSERGLGRFIGITREKYRRFFHSKKTKEDVYTPLANKFKEKMKVNQYNKLFKKFKRKQEEYLEQSIKADYKKGMSIEDLVNKYWATKTRTIEYINKANTTGILKESMGSFKV